LGIAQRTKELDKIVVEAASDLLVKVRKEADGVRGGNWLAEDEMGDMHKNKPADGSEELLGVPDLGFTLADAASDEEE
jgi:hypothetical protein